MSSRLSAKKRTNKQKNSEETLQWYYVNEEKQDEGHSGPFDVQELKNLYLRRIINKDTFVWNGRTVPKWTTIREVLRHGKLKLPRIKHGHNRSLSTNCVTLSEDNPLERPSRSSFEKRLSITSSSSSLNRKRARRRHYELHSTLYVMDQGGNLEKAEIIDLKDEEMKIHYMGYPSQYDEWIPMDSDRIAAKRVVKRSRSKLKSAIDPPKPFNRASAKRTCSHEFDDDERSDPTYSPRHRQKLAVPTIHSVNQVHSGSQLGSDFEDKSSHEIVEEWLDQNFLFSSYFSGVDQKVLWKAESALRDLVKTLQDDKENMIAEADDLERDNLRLREKYTDLKQSSTREIESKKHDLETAQHHLEMETKKIQIIEARLQGEFDVKLMEAKAVFDKNLQNEKQRIAARFDALLQKELEKTKKLQEEFEKQKVEAEVEKQNSNRLTIEQISHLKESVQAKEGELLRSDTEKQHLVDKMETLEASMAHLRIEKERVESERIKLIEKMTAKFENMTMQDNDRVSTLLDQLTDAQVQNSKFADEISSLRSELNDQTRIAETAQRQIEMLTEDKGKLEIELLNANAMARKANTLERELLSKKTDYTRDMEKLRRKLDSNEKSWKEKKENAEKNAEKIWKEKVDHAINEGVAAQKDLKHQLELEKINTAKVQAKLDQTLLKDNTSELQKVNEKLTFENEQLQKRITSLEALEQRFQSEEERYLNRESGWKRDRDDFVKKLARMDSQMEILHSSKLDLEQQNFNLQEELDTVWDSMNPLTKEKSNSNFRSPRKSSAGGMANQELLSLFTKIRETDEERLGLEKSLNDLPFVE